MGAFVYILAKEWESLFYSVKHIVVCGSCFTYFSILTSQPSRSFVITCCVFIYTSATTRASEDCNTPWDSMRRIVYEEIIPAVIISQSSYTKNVNVSLNGYFRNLWDLIKGRILKAARFRSFFISGR